MQPNSGPQPPPLRRAAAPSAAGSRAQAAVCPLTGYPARQGTRRRAAQAGRHVKGRAAAPRARANVMPRRAGRTRPHEAQSARRGCAHAYRSMRTVTVRPPICALFIASTAASASSLEA